MEFPRYCYDLNMQDYRYVYGSVLFHEESEKPGVCSVVTIRYQNPLFGLVKELKGCRNILYLCSRSQSSSFFRSLRAFFSAN